MSQDKQLRGHLIAMLVGTGCAGMASGSAQNGACAHVIAGDDESCTPESRAHRAYPDERANQDVHPLSRRQLAEVGHRRAGRRCRRVHPSIVATSYAVVAPAVTAARQRPSR